MTKELRIPLKYSHVTFFFHGALRFRKETVTLHDVINIFPYFKCRSYFTISVTIPDNDKNRIVKIEK